MPMDRRKKDKIEKLKNRSGDWLETKEDIGDEIYRNLMSTLTTKGPRNLAWSEKFYNYDN